ncbi:TonB family protein [Proteiniphilum sp.]|uniref:energy transducer TonB n=1 Tax=Proteiniphilum sp. TaxID=1926877 RepID=UPI002B20E995|nr:TonB family protein [Proteiniphilum sp.]MEA4917737.1 TonB family protein [Proteiniphilum sp.]
MDRDEVKKSSEANLEKDRNTYILMGMVLVLSLLFFAFEWSTKPRKPDESVFVPYIEPEEDIVITRREEVSPPLLLPPPPQLRPHTVEEITPEEIEVVDKEVDVIMEIPDEEVKPQKQEGIFIPPPPPPLPRQKVEEEETDEIYKVVDEQPEFPGGLMAMNKYLNDNLRYPGIALERGLSGRVLCIFIVEKDGSINDVQVLRGVDPSLDREAVRVVRQMPPWSPGKRSGEPVRVRITLPVNFRLQH